MTVSIDLGDRESWTPSATPRPRRRGRRAGPARWVAVLLAAFLTAFTAGVPAGDVAAAGPMLRVGTGASGVLIGGGRVFVSRSTPEGTHRLEAYTAAGTRLWGAELGEFQQLVYADAGVAMLAAQFGEDRALETAGALDPRTGAERWARGGVSLLGRAHGLVVLEDTSAYPPAASASQDSPTRLVTADERTGAPGWTVTVPAGSGISFGRERAQPYDLTSFSVLDPGGRLRGYDLATGAVARTDQLRLTGPVRTFELGDEGRDGGPPGARAGQVAVGDAVYDRASGRLLWQVPIEVDPLIGCAPGVWCRRGEAGLIAYDAVTGRQRWRIDGLDLVLGATGEAAGALLVGGVGTDGEFRAGGLVVDAHTGATRARIADWYPVPSRGGRTVLWRSGPEPFTTTLGLLDLATGRIAVFGTGGPWAGGPTCANDDRIVACGVVGDLAVWPLPPSARG